MLEKEIFYIADFSLPNKSAYALHVLKMCDAFKEKTKKKVNLLIPSCNSNYQYFKIRQDYLLKNKINIVGFFSKKKNLNFILRIFFALKIFKFIKERNVNSLIYSRSIITSIFLAVLKIKNTLEIHTELTGLSKKIFFITKFKHIETYLKFVFIHKNLREKFNIKKNKTLILADAVDYRDFNIKKKNLLKHTCFYSGSFVKGKGLEIIFKIAKKLPEINFHLFGNIDTIYDKKLISIKSNNIQFKGYLSYSKLTKEIQNYKIVLLPYSKNVGVLISNINVANYFSPLKMFEYLASGKIILASNLKVYDKILRDNINCIKIDNDINKWCKKIKEIFKTNKYSFLGNTAKKDAKKYSWNSRVLEILKFNK